MWGHLRICQHGKGNIFAVFTLGYIYAVEKHYCLNTFWKHSFKKEWITLEFWFKSSWKMDYRHTS